MIVLSQTWFMIMAAVAAGHWLLPARLRGWGLVAVAAAFLGWKSPESLALLTAFAGVLYGAAGRQADISGKKLVLLIAFFATTLLSFKVLAGQHIDIANPAGLVIPFGLSYYTLRCIHYAIEKYRGRISAHDFSSFAQYLFFLPTLIAGPIHRFPSFLEDLGKKRWDPYLFGEGLQRILFGAVKISFIANFLVSFQLETIIMALETPVPALSAYLAMVQMGLDIYFRFAGYSDIAIGFSMLLGFRVMENFNFPFRAQNISDFWSRWHISLTSWCRDYIYMGVIAVSRSPALATLAAMVTLGLWHEVSLRYLLWGAYNGMGIVIWQMFQKTGLRLPGWAGQILTLHFFMAGLVLVRHDTLGEALMHWGAILGLV